MTYLAEIQEFTKNRSALTESAERFIGRFELNWKKLIRSCKKIHLSTDFSIGDKDKKGFLNDLSYIFLDFDLKSLSVKCEAYIEKQNGKLSLSDFLDEILMLNEDQLRKLAKMHSEVVQTDPGAVPNKSFRDIIQYFDIKDKNTDRVEAGHFIMMLSQLALNVLGLKTIFNQFKPLTIDRIDAMLETNEPANIERYQKNMDDALDMIGQMQNSLSKNNSNLVDLKVWLNTLSRQRRDVLKWMLVNSSKGINGSRERMSKAMRSLKAWGEWKVLCQNDERAESATGEEQFASVISNVKDKLQEISQGFYDLLDSMDLILNKGISGISLFCQDLLSELKQVFENILKNDNLSKNLKKIIQKIYIRAQNLAVRIMQHLELEIDELKCLPDVFKRRILYISYEVPRILSRGNSKEIKNMALVVNFNYRLSKIMMTKPSFENIEKNSKDQITKILQTRTIMIVQNSNELLRMMMPVK